MADGINSKVVGLADVRRALLDVPNKLRYRLLRNALAAGGRLIRDEGRRLSPVMKVAVKDKAGKTIRKPGTVRNAITVRTSKLAKRKGDVGVFINVRPATAKSGKRGAKSPDDPFYWRWVEFGSRKLRGFGMLKGAAAKTGQALSVFSDRLAKGLRKLNEKGRL